MPKRRLAVAVPLAVLTLALVAACSFLNSPPIASFTFHLSQRYSPCVVTFDASSSHDPDKIIVKYEWSFGDGSIGSGESTSYTYTASGTYAVNLTVTDNGGKTSSASETITVMPPYNPPPPYVPSPPAKEVYFPDLGLEAHIRNTIAKPTGQIYDSDLVELTHLIANRGNCYWVPDCQLVSSLEGIQHCTNLTELGLDGNQITDISALSALTDLTYLELHDNQIVEIRPLAGLTKLTYLALWNNEIRYISALSELTNLTDLFLYNNSIKDIGALSGLTKLAVLELQNTGISDIGALSSLTKLTKLMLDNNSISDIWALVANAGLGAGDLVFIRNNSLDLTPGSDDMLNIQTLEGRGVNISY